MSSPALGVKDFSKDSANNTSEAQSSVTIFKWKKKTMPTP